MSQQQRRLVTIAKIAAGAAAVAGVIYLIYLRKQILEETTTITDERKASSAKEQQNTTTPTVQAAAKHLDIQKASREDVIRLLNAVKVTQGSLAVVMKQLTADVLEKKLSVIQTYESIQAQPIGDPLEDYGLSIAGFDALLERFAADTGNEEYLSIIRTAEIHDAITEIVQGGQTVTTDTATKHISEELVIILNRDMRDKLKEVINELQTHVPRAKYYPRAASLTAQAMVTAFIKTKHDVTDSDVENAMVVHGLALSGSDEFIEINKEIQNLMNQLLHWGQRFN